MFRQTSLYLTDESRQRLQSLSKHYRTSMSKIIRSLIDQRFDAINRKKKDEKGDIPKVD